MHIIHKITSNTRLKARFLRIFFLKTARTFFEKRLEIRRLYPMIENVQVHMYDFIYLLVSTND